MSYLNQTWEIKTTKVPKIKKHCSKCGEDTDFLNSYKFRVNANGKNLDIWMIFNCIHCKTSYNLTLFERIKPSTLDNDVLEAFTQNSETKIEEVAVQSLFYTKNKVAYYYDDDAYQIEGHTTDLLKNNYCITLHMKNEVPIRMDKFLCTTMKLSRSALKQHVESKKIRFESEVKPNKHMIRDGMKFYINASI